jgi:lysyl-tRNA synthetase class 2
MSEQQPQGADQALDLNNELQSRREKLAAPARERHCVPERLPS